MMTYVWTEKGEFPFMSFAGDDLPRAFQDRRAHTVEVAYTNHSVWYERDATGKPTKISVTD